jgi:hypothetical protein
MTKEIYDFRIRVDKKVFNVGDTIYSPNGRKGKVEEITTVKMLGNGQVEVKVKASL